MSKQGVLLINLGTPNNCDLQSVQRYLKEFLMDPRVIDLPFLLRFPLVNGLVIPLRSKKSTLAYQKIWSKEGSPLRTHSQALKKALSSKLGDAYQVELGMRYGEPSLETALNKLNGSENITLLPLFPQYSSAATGSAIEKALQLASKKKFTFDINTQKDFFNNPDYISTQAEIIKENTFNKPIDLFLFSYHGLPERHIKKIGCSPCPSDQPCPNVDIKNANCYRAQCYQTSHLLAKTLSLSPNQYKVCFQSRLGKTPWIKPYIDLVLKDLIRQGIKNIAIACPSFVADCLETLEEINIGIRAQWTKLGGENFTFVPSLNAHPLWVNTLVKMIKAD